MQRSLGYPVMNIWGMYPVTNWIVETRPETMEAPAIEYGNFNRMGGAFLGQVPLRMSQYAAAPLSEEEVAERQPYASVSALDLAYYNGMYIHPGQAEWGRFPTIGPGALSVRA